MKKSVLIVRLKTVGSNDKKGELTPTTHGVQCPSDHQCPEDDYYECPQVISKVYTENRRDPKQDNY